MIEVIKENVFVRTYNSLSEFFKHTDRNNRTVLEKEKIPHHNIVEGMEEMSEDSNWRFGKDDTLDKYKIARTDPNYGRNLCKESISNQTRSKEYQDLLKLALTYRKKQKLMDMGGRISVPHAVSGEDKYFIQNKAASKPTVKIGINMCVSAAVSPNDLIKIAEQAVPIIYLLESAGIATEVFMCTFADDTYDDRDDFRFTVFEVPVKSAQQRFNWSTFAPVFCTATYRYNFFRSWCMHEKKISWGFGHPMEDSEVKDIGSKLGYTSIIGVNKVGAFDKVREVFQKIK
jgi:hypothetical protein